MDEKDLQQEENSESPEASEIAVEESIPPDEQDNGSFDWPSFAIAGMFALLIICLSLIFYALNLHSDISDKNMEIEKKSALISELRSSVQKNHEILSILADRNLTLVKMSGLQVNPRGYGNIFLHPDSGKALLQLSDLPPTAENEVYKLWMFQNNNPISVGTFTIKDRTNSFIILDDLPSFLEEKPEFAISLETNANVSNPKGEYYLMSNRSSTK